MQTSRQVTQAELARALGVTRQAISDLVARAVLTMDAAGRIDLDQARATIAERVRPSGKTAAAAAPLAPPPPPQPAPISATFAAAPQPQPAETSMNYHVARTLREASEASIAQLKLRQLTGDLIQRDPATQATFTAFRQLRDALQTMGRNLAPKLAALHSDSHAIEHAINAAVSDVLGSFQRKTLPSLAARMGNSADATATIGARP